MTPIGRIAAVLAAGLLAATLGRAAAAQEAAGTCQLPVLDHGPALGLGHVESGTVRVNFLKEREKSPGCPADTPACRARAFLVPGNVVILAQRQGPLVCATYVGRGGATRSGWLPATAVTEDPAPAVAPADWAGTWTQTEATLTLKTVAGGRLAIKGDATWGAGDPDRVKRGAVNTGEIAGEVAPDGAGLAFTMGQNETLAITAGDPTDCRVWMRRLGAVLLVDDNNQCGGMNVSFRGLYTR